MSSHSESDRTDRISSFLHEHFPFTMLYQFQIFSVIGLTSARSFVFVTPLLNCVM